MNKAHEVANNEVFTPEKLLFVLCLWRSGSSLLYALLNQHSQVSLMYEADLPRLHRFLSDGFQDGTWRQRWEFWNRGPSRHEIAIESLPAQVPDAWEAARVVYREAAKRKPAAVWGEKTPHWSDCPLQLASKFPEARLIFLWRDVHFILESILHAGRSDRFFGKSGFAERVLFGNEKLKQAFDLLKAQDRLVLDVNYEELTVNTRDCMAQICDFLEIPFEDSVVSLVGASRSAINVGGHHDRVRTNAIRRQTSPAEILSPALRSKIDRYICRWKNRYGPEWPKYPLQVTQEARPVGAVERWCDWTKYQLALSRDRTVQAIYGLLPIGYALRLRGWLHQRSRTSAPVPLAQ